MATSPARNPFIVKPRSNFPCVSPNHKAKYIAAIPPPHAARVVLAATLPIPCISTAESVLPGLKPYQPNHRINPPTAATVRLWGAGGHPPPLLRTLPNRGPK